jgi:hypothetical protein
MSSRRDKEKPAFDIASSHDCFVEDASVERDAARRQSPIRRLTGM